MTKSERVVMLNQFKLLSISDPENSGHYSNLIEILENGFTYHYEELYAHISEEMPEEECKFVVDVLELHSKLKLCWENLTDKGDVAENQVRFLGFDGNYETSQLVYCEFFVNKLGRYDELQRENFNSHAPTLDRYRAMLNKWRALGRPGSPTIDQIRAIVNP